MKIDVFEGRSVKMGVVVFFAVGVSEAVCEAVSVGDALLPVVGVSVGFVVCVGDGVTETVEVNVVVGVELGV